MGPPSHDIGRDARYRVVVITARQRPSPRNTARGEHRTTARDLVEYNIRPHLWGSYIVAINMILSILKLEKCCHSCSL